MADYKVIHRAEGAEIPWEPGCPVALTAVQVSRNTETSEAWLQAKARNVSDMEAGSVYADLSLEYADGTGETIPAEFLDADVPAGAERPLKPRRLPRGDVQSCSLTVRRVEGPNCTWESTGEASPLPSPEKLSLSPRALSQRARAIGAKAGDSVLHSKVQDHGVWWVCACGQVNVRRESCCRCGSSKELLTANEDEAALLADADEREEETFAEAVELKERGTIESLGKAANKLRSIGDHEGAAELLAQCEGKLSELRGARKKRRKRIAAIVSAVAAVSIIAAVVVTQVIIPAQEQAAEEARIAQEKAAEEERIAQQRAAEEERVAQEKAEKEARATQAQERIRSSQAYVQSGSLTVELGEFVQSKNNGYEPITWRVLAVEEDRALLISSSVLAFRPFNNDESKGNDYETSDIKTWLEGEFAEDAFGEGAESDLIIGSPFLLSSDQANAYFQSGDDRGCSPSAWASASGKKASLNGYSAWWLSSPGRDSGDAACVWPHGRSVGSYGDIGEGSTSSALGIRPAVWIKL